MGPSTAGAVKKRGRPRISEHPNERVDVRLPQPMYDAVCRYAGDRRSVPAVIRDAIERFLVREEVASQEH